ncbi:MAG TPA: MBL fold metallo-hydrolase [Candidatus Paceibacterota bacterium]
MKFTKFERSGIILESNSGFRLAIDVANKTPIEELEGIKVDAMLSSHIHGDHFSLDHIKKLNPNELYLNHECIEILGEEKLESIIKEVKIGDSIIIGDIEVTLFEVDHGPNVTSKPKENFGFLINIDNKIIYFAGDMFLPSGIDVSNLEIDYAFIPVGTFYTFGPQEAFDFAKQFKQINKIISMHYDIEPGSHEKFINLCGGFFNVE